MEKGTIFLKNNEKFTIATLIKVKSNKNYQKKQ